MLQPGIFVHFETQTKGFKASSNSRYMNLYYLELICCLNFRNQFLLAYILLTETSS